MMIMIIVVVVVVVVVAVAAVAVVAVAVVGPGHRKNIGKGLLLTGPVIGKNVSPPFMVKNDQNGQNEFLKK